MNICRKSSDFNIHAFALAFWAVSKCSGVPVLHPDGDVVDGSVFHTAAVNCLLAFLPLTMFMWLLLILSAFFAVFIVVRIFVRSAVPSDEMENFQYVTAQVVNPGEYYNPEAVAEANAGVTEGLVG